MATYWWAEAQAGPGNHRWNIHGFPAGTIHSGSMVLMNVCELGEPGDVPFIGDADMEIRNIAPRANNTVDVWFNIDWGSPLPIRLGIFVFP
jgi:hypothetical protein